MQWDYHNFSSSNVSFSSFDFPGEEFLSGQLQTCVINQSHVNMYGLVLLGLYFKMSSYLLVNCKTVSGSQF